ncbi:hypothetical protein Pelo_3423 [Pelomyxa schiedti]|nr:hypothetical protein Pelo_3423 [Pelomyxa schiedti]
MGDDSELEQRLEKNYHDIVSFRDQTRELFKQAKKYQSVASHMCEEESELIEWIRTNNDAIARPVGDPIRNGINGIVAQIKQASANTDTLARCIVGDSDPNRFFQFLELDVLQVSEARKKIERLKLDLTNTMKKKIDTKAQYLLVVHVRLIFFQVEQEQIKADIDKAREEYQAKLTEVLSKRDTSFLKFALRYARRQVSYHEDCLKSFSTVKANLESLEADIEKDGNQETTIKQGNMLMKTPVTGVMRDYFFQIKGPLLLRFKGKDFDDSVPLAMSTIRAHQNRGGPDDDKRFDIVVTGKKSRTITLQANSPQDRSAWIDALARATSGTSSSDSSDSMPPSDKVKSSDATEPESSDVKDDLKPVAAIPPPPDDRPRSESFDRITLERNLSVSSIEKNTSVRSRPSTGRLSGMSETVVQWNEAKQTFLRKPLHPSMRTPAFKLKKVPVWTLKEQYVTSSQVLMPPPPNHPPPAPRLEDPSTPFREPSPPTQEIHPPTPTPLTPTAVSHTPPHVPPSRPPLPPPARKMLPGSKPPLPPPPAPLQLSSTPDIAPPPPVESPIAPPDALAPPVVTLTEASPQPTVTPTPAPTQVVDTTPSITTVPPTPAPPAQPVTAPAPPQTSTPAPQPTPTTTVIPPTPVATPAVVPATPITPAVTATVTPAPAPSPTPAQVQTPPTSISTPEPAPKVASTPQTPIQPPTPTPVTAPPPTTPQTPSAQPSTTEQELSMKLLALRKWVSETVWTMLEVETPALRHKISSCPSANDVYPAAQFVKQIKAHLVKAEEILPPLPMHQPPSVQLDQLGRLKYMLISVVDDIEHTLEAIKLTMATSNDWVEIKLLVQAVQLVYQGMKSRPPNLI